MTSQNSAPNSSNQCDTDSRDEKTDEKMSAANSDTSLKLAESCVPSQRSETNDEYHECQEHEIDNELELDDSFDSFTHETTDTDALSSMDLGTLMSDLPKIDNFLSEALPICRAIDHAILYDLDTVWMDDHAPLPYPESFDHKNMHWDIDHVHLPCAHDFWPTIKQSLKSLAVKLDSVEDMKNAISKFRKLNYHGLSTYVFIKGDSQEEVLRLFQKIAGLAAELPTICTRSIPLLRRQVDSKVSMSQKQAACLLANAFFCTYPLRNNPRLAPLTFAGLFKHQPEAREASQFAKLDCILNYFRRVFESMPNGTITFHRKVLKKKDLPSWSKSEAKILDKLRVSSRGRMEEDGRNMMCVDFANKFVGGGVLGRGCVQEEIMFLLCPELIISRLLAEELDDNETLVVKGFERFNVARGYGRKFTWGGNYVDTSPRDKWCRRATEVLVMDALVLKENTVYEQLLKKCMKRELNKAYCGFHDSTQNVSTIVTGNWGCGAFGGDPLVKFLIQLMAASLAQRPMFYLTYHDVNGALEINEIHEQLLKSDCTVGQLYQSLQKAADKYGQQLTATHIYSLITKRPLPHNIRDKHTSGCMDTCIVQ